MRHNPCVKRFATYLAAVVMTLVIVVASLLLFPVTRISHSSPPSANDAALATSKLKEWQQEEAARSDIRPQCRTKFLNLDKPVTRVVVLLHGFTNCPAQWDEFAKELVADGWGVIVPRLDGHGIIGDKPDALTKVTSKSLTKDVTRAIDIAAGLGDKVAVTGISSGGIVALWAGTVRNVDRVVSIAPAFVPTGVPQWVGTGLDRVARLIPNIWVWWDGNLKEAVPGPPYAYKAYSTKAYGEVARIGQVVRRRSPEIVPTDVRMLLNKEDEAINNDAPLALIDSWKDQGIDVKLTWLDAPGVPHDIIDPNQVKADTAKTYPQVMALLKDL